EPDELKLLDSSEAIKETSQADPNHYPSSEEENIDQNNNNEGEKDENNTDLTALEQRKQEIEVQRAGARVRFTRNQLEPCDNDFISLKDVPEVETSFRSAVGVDSVAETQGQKHCMYTSVCTTKKCACKNAGRKYNSRC
uniref:Uncharacterized protein n=1 Tax=Acrobeloides nanus TaxID=290746 RepID=A0A914DV32_9BILA